jgi:thiosulfate/3-mercaptopyruvate sulfurtransferase
MSAQAAEAPVFVDAAWLAQNLGQPHVKVIEISDEVSYEFDRHIPGAFLAGKEYWRKQDDDGVRTHLPIAELQARVRALGIDDDDQVILYYKGNSVTEVQGAFYAYWIFNLLGHDAVSILDGGWHAWLAAGGDTDDTQVVPEPGGFTARPRPALEMGVDDLHALYRDHPVVDGRPHDYWLGRDKFPANIKYGRIPGSLSQPWESFLKQDDKGLTYADASLPIELLAEHALDKNALILLTCFGAAGAAINYAYFKAAGFDNLRLDDEGYKRWNLRDYPLEKGEPSVGTQTPP